MKQQSLSISVPKPCNENWLEMTPVEKGRHCKSCQKTVVDFTRMPKVEIAKIVTRESGNLCGRFSSDQLNVELIPPKPSKTWLKYAAIILGLVPTVGCGQEIVTPEKPAEEIVSPPITGDIEIVTIGEVVEFNDVLHQELEVSGMIIDAKTKKALPTASLINLQSSKVRIPIKVYRDGKFKARIPENSMIGVSCGGYEAQIFRYADLVSKSQLVIALEEKYDFPMGVVVIRHNDPRKKPTKGKIKIETDNKPRKTERIENIENINVEELKRSRRKTINDSQIEISSLVNGNDKEVCQYIFRAVKVVAPQTIVTQGIVMCGNTVNEEKKKGWLNRIWRKLKSLVTESHQSAQEYSDLSSEKSENAAIASHTMISNNAKPIKIAEESISMKVFPNPSYGIFKIEISNKIDEFYIEVMDMNNQLVLRKSDEEFDGNIDLSNYAQGSYIISVLVREKLISSQVVLKI